MIFNIQKLVASKELVEIIIGHVRLPSDIKKLVTSKELVESVIGHVRLPSDIAS